jgi:Protein of unknown function (DUF3307)
VTADPVLVVGWLVLAHLVADFVLQTESIVVDKTSSGRSAWRGLLAHGSAVGLCLTPFAAAFGDRGATLVVVVTVAHVVIDRWKVRATRHAEAVALAAAHRRHASTEPGAGLGPAWTPTPGALFIVDQVGHVFVSVVAWIVLVAYVPPIDAFSAGVAGVLGGLDPGTFHRATLVAVVGAALAIVNVRAAALFVATLVHPRHAVTGDEPVEQAAGTGPQRHWWQIRFGPLVATAEAAASSGVDAPGLARPAPQHAVYASPARIGATIGVLERLLIVTFVLTNATAAIGFVIGAKTLARFKQLDDRDFAEYYLLGTLASVAVALGSALLADAALATVGL